MSNQNYVDSQLYRIRHSTAHIMAQVVTELFAPGEAKVAIGPAIDNGFYYDFDLPRNLTPEDLKEIQKRMKKLIGQKVKFEKKVISAEEAKKIFRDQPYKLELIEGLEHGGLDEHSEPLEGDMEISIYTSGEFVDLCRGPHVEDTSEVNPNAIKLMSIAGAYWRGDEKNPQLQRIYGTVWNTKEELDEYLNLLEEAKKRDHRKLGKELDLFLFEGEVGPGLPLWTPRGTAIIEEIERLAHETEREHGYKTVRTPHLTKEDLFYRSGHLPYYTESMYPAMEMDGSNYYIKPMNCPFHHKVCATQIQSYRDLPLRLAEYGTCYRYEKSGELFGLMRVRSMQMNDAHIYCTEEQFEAEFIDVVNIYLKYFKLLGIDKYIMRLSTHSQEGLGKKYVDNKELWLKTEGMVRDVMEKNNIPYVERDNEAAFYGPKIDVQIYSAIGKEFTLATNQVDFSQPGSFDLKYIDQNGEEKIPLCLHRAPLSTHERLIGFLIEHYAGAFPVWLSPEHVRVIPITDSHFDYAKQLADDLYKMGFRSEADLGSAKMNNKIRQSQKMKIPYMLVVGDKEMENNTVALRKRDGTQENDLPFSEFVEILKEKVETRSPDL
ncbi:MAG: threonine--tRNA ligase [Anaerolineales bacterium]|nr:threonine--tRNA ligase [Anaerolineales bacterium]